MAGLLCKARIETCALTGGALKTAIQLKNAANHAFRLMTWGVYFDGTSATNQPPIVYLYIPSTDGTMSAPSGTTQTLEKQDQTRPETIQTTALFNASADPTISKELETKNVHPQNGYEKIYPYGHEILFGGASAGAGRIAIAIKAANNVNATAEMTFEE